MSQYPKVHSEKCPYCGKRLNLVETKYEWDFYYECEGCHRKYPFKNSQPPDIRAVYDTTEYKNYKSWKDQTQAAETPNVRPTISTHSSTFSPYICKQFQDVSDLMGAKSYAIDDLQRYLNTNRITRDRIVSLTTAAYYGLSVITLVHI